MIQYTKRRYSLVVELRLPKPTVRVRFPLPAPKRRWKMIRFPSSFLSIEKAMAYLLFVGRTRRMTQDTASGMQHALACISSALTSISCQSEHISPKRASHHAPACIFCGLIIYNYTKLDKIQILALFYIESIAFSCKILYNKNSAFKKRRDKTPSKL